MTEPEESKPNPDPTDKTHEEILRENAWLKELLNERILGRVDVLKSDINGVRTRLDGMDKALELLQTRADRVPSETDIAVNNLRQIHEVKFDSVALQFSERDTRTDQTTKDSVKAIDAAFQSADKAITKTENAVSLQIQEQGKRIDNVSKSADDKIADIKERLTTIEARTAGITQNKAETVIQARDSTSFVMAAVASGIAVCSIIAVVAIGLTRPAPYVPPPPAATPR